MLTSRYNDESTALRRPAAASKSEAELNSYNPRAHDTSTERPRCSRLHRYAEAHGNQHHRSLVVRTMCVEVIETHFQQSELSSLGLALSASTANNWTEQVKSAGVADVGRGLSDRIGFCVVHQSRQEQEEAERGEGRAGLSFGLGSARASDAVWGKPWISLPCRSVSTERKNEVNHLHAEPSSM